MASNQTSQGSITFGHLDTAFMVICPAGDGLIVQPEASFVISAAPFISSMVPLHLCYLYSSSHHSRHLSAESHAALSNSLVQEWNITFRYQYTDSKLKSYSLKEWISPAAFHPPALNRELRLKNCKAVFVKTLKNTILQIRSYLV